MVVVTKPSSGHFPCLRKVPTPIFVHAFVSEPPVETFASPVLHRRSRLDQVIPDSPYVPTQSFGATPKYY